MARRRSSNYKQIQTGTKDLGDVGDQIHIAKVDKLDEQLKGCYVNNMLISVQAQETSDNAPLPAYTVYLSTAKEGEWDDDQVITARSTAQGGGTLNLVAKRRILTNDVDHPDSSIGPIHVWIEATDIPHDDNVVRMTMEVWGRMHRLTNNFA